MLSLPTTMTSSTPTSATCVWDRPSRSSPAGNQLPSKTDGLVQGLAAGDVEPLARDGDGDAVEAGESTGAVADVEPGGPDASGVATAAGLVLEVQAATRRATAIVVVKGESEGRISMSSGRYVA
ncbi:MAG: hypothetical protein A2V84_05505 [Chloroflexi bacterium RBG_16_70_13]|nr:MAG: hypothetical protein A2V84_05505 [Chloroflexi bacterium RBG_16_70_13]